MEKTLQTQLPTTDPEVIRPNHYTKFKIEPVEFCMKNGLEFWLGNVIKYAVRAGGKVYDGLSETESEIRDLRKAQRYLEMRINQLERKEVL